MDLMESCSKVPFIFYGEWLYNDLRLLKSRHFSDHSCPASWIVGDSVVLLWDKAHFRGHPGPGFSALGDTRALCIINVSGPPTVITMGRHLALGVNCASRRLQRVNPDLHPAHVAM